MAVDAMGTVLPLINGSRAFFEPNFEPSRCGAYWCLWCLNEEGIHLQYVTESYSCEILKACHFLLPNNRTKSIITIYKAVYSKNTTSPFHCLVSKKHCILRYNTY